MSEMITLTATIVRKAKPAEKEYAIHDTKQPGFILRVQPSGAKSWCIRIGSKRITLAAVSELSLRDARTEARALLRREARQAKEAPSTALTFAELSESFLEAMQGRYAHTTFGPLKVYLNGQLLPAFGKTRIDRLKSSQIADWFYTYSRTAPGGANAALGHLRSILSFVRDRGYLDHTAPDPTAPLIFNHMPARGQLLNSEQLRRLGKVLTRPPKGTAPAAKAIRLTLLTGCRPYEIARLRWKDVGQDRLHLFRTKTGPRDVILSKEAMAYLDRLQCKRRGELLFSELKAEKKNAIFRNMWFKIRERAELPETLRLHGLRHTYASQAIMSGETLATTGALLGHADAGSTEQYVHLDGGHLIETTEVVCSEVEAMLGS